MRDRKYVTRLLALIVSTCEPFDPQQLQPLDSLDTFLIMLDYDCETPALQLPDLDELHDSSQDNPSTTTGSRSRKGLGNGPERAWVTVPKGPGSRGNRVTWPRHEFQKGLGHGPKIAWVTVPKGPGSRGNWVTWPRYEFQKGLGHGPERAWVTVPKGPESRS